MYFHLYLEIKKRCESNRLSVFYDSQFCFRDNHSTNDAVFLFHAIIQEVSDHKSKLRLPKNIGLGQ